MLRELQRGFIAALDGAGDAPPLFAGRLAGAGFAAYRNNFLAGTRKALGSDYPVVARLVGDDCFAALARAYRREWPSRSGSLEHFGQHFPEFLAQCYATTAHAYLADVARLERAIDACLLAPAAPVIGIESLAALTPADLASLRLEADPALRLLRSPWPVVAVWDMHHDGDDLPPVDLAEGGVDVVVQRVACHVELRSIERECFDLLYEIVQGTPLAVACGRVFGDTAAEVAGHALARLFAWGCITGLGLHPSTVLHPQAGDKP